MALIIKDAQVRGQVTDVRIERGTISSIGPGMRCEAGDQLLDGQGGALIPGLHDHHIHLTAWAAARESVFVGPSAVTGKPALAAVLSRSSVGPDGWIRAVGYHESVAGDLDRHVLDKLVPDRPVRVQHRSGVLWFLNTRALDLVGAYDEYSPGLERDEQNVPTGRLWRMDTWLGERLARLLRVPESSSDRWAWLRSTLAELSSEAASRGVTGWTDATPGRSDSERSELREAVAAGLIKQRLHLMMPLDFRQRACSDGDPGPVKVLLDDTNLPPLDSMAELISGAHRQQRAVAVHCVTATQLAFAVAAFDASADGAPAGGSPDREGDRIEHGAVIPSAYLGLLAERRLTVVTQPNFIFERGDEYLSEVDSAELPDLWRGRSLLDSGVRTAAGTDAPFGSADPWVAVRASVRRRTRAGSLLGVDESLEWAPAIGLWHGEATAPTKRRRVAAGHPADLVLLDGPLPEALDADAPVGIRATLIGGECVFESG